MSIYDVNICAISYAQQIERYSVSNDLKAIISLFEVVLNNPSYTQVEKKLILESCYITARRNLNAYGSCESVMEFERKLDELIPMACPREGGFKAYKGGAFISYKAIDKNKWYDVISTPRPALIELYIPSTAKRSSAFGDKCRCDMAQVKKIIRLDTREEVSSAVSIFDSEFEYQVNSYVKPTNSVFDTNRFNECSTGIHFFMDSQTAINYIIPYV